MVATPFGQVCVTGERRRFSVDVSGSKRHGDDWIYVTLLRLRVAIVKTGIRSPKRG